MSNETIILAKNLDLTKVEYPVSVTEKLDGVPAVFSTLTNGTVVAHTRQGEQLHSVQHICSALYANLPLCSELIGELYVPGLPFKDIGGLVRREDPSPELILYVWDYNIMGVTNLTYFERMERFASSTVQRAIDDNSCIRLLDGKWIDNEARLMKYCKEFTEQYPDKEGLVIRSIHGRHSCYQPGKRSWGFMRYKAEETVDLRLLRVEEAVNAKTGKGNGMAGRLICEYRGKEIGVGPGTLTHKERIDLWQGFPDWVGSIIEVAYKPDPSYEALREARFKRFRPDKSEPSTL